MADMQSIERAGAYYNSDIGAKTSAMKRMGAQSDNLTAEETKGTKEVKETKEEEKVFRDAVEKYKQKDQAADGKEELQKELTPQQMKKAVDEANRQAKMQQTSLEFTYYEDLNRYSVKIKDKTTNEVIREFPPEESLKTLENIWKLAGIIVDESI